MAGRQVVIRGGQDLGVAIAEARKVRGLTQQQLAELSGVDRTYLAKIESGLSVALLERSLRLLRRLGARIVVELPTPVLSDADPDDKT